MKKTEIVVGSIVLTCVLALPELAMARDLVSASNSTASTVKSVAQALAVTGVIAGGAFMQLPGAGEWGKRVMVSGLVGCLCAFGAPAFQTLMRSVFGGL